MNNKDEEILILVYHKNNPGKEIIIKESNIIRCAQCQVPAIIEFTNGYKINF